MHVLFMPLDFSVNYLQYEQEALQIIEMVGDQNINLEHLCKAYALMYLKAQEASTNKYGLSIITGGTLSVMPKYDMITIFEVDILPTPTFWLYSDIKEFKDHYAIETWYGNGQNMLFLGFHGCAEISNPSS